MKAAISSLLLAILITACPAQAQNTPHAPSPSVSPHTQPPEPLEPQHPPPSSRPAQKVRLVLKFFHQFQFAGYYAALWNGLYAQEGLDVEILDASAERSALAAVLAGRAEFGVSGMDLLRARAQGAPIVALAMIFQHSPVIILSLPQAGIRSPSDLQGRRVMGSQDDLFEAFALMYAAGANPDSVQWLPHNNSVAALLENRIDASVDYLSNEPWQLRARGAQPRIIQPVEWGLDFYGDMLFTTEKLAAKNPRLVEAFTRASLRGWQIALDNPGAFIPRILRLPGVRERGLDQAHLTQEAAHIQRLCAHGMVEPGHINPARLNRLSEQLKEFHLLPESFDSAEFIHTPPPPRPPLPAWALSAAALTLALAAAAFFWRATLRRRAAALSEQIREATRRALEASRRKADFLGILSHELRTPLNGILGPADLLRQEAPTPRAAELLDELSLHGTQYLALIEGLLDIAASSSQSPDPPQTTCPLGEVLDECRALWEPQLAARPGGGLIRQLYPGLPLQAPVGIPAFRHIILLALHLATQNAARPLVTWRIAPHPEREGWWEFEFSSPARPPSPGPPHPENYLDKTPPPSGHDFALSLLRKACSQLGGTLHAELPPFREARIICALPIPSPAPQKS